MMILAAFSSCCCYEFWLPFPAAAAEAFAATAAGPRIGKHHGSEGTLTMPNVTSETHRK